MAGLRAGHFGRAQCDARTEICAGAVSPWRLLEGAIAVYTVSSQLGYEAILAGHLHFTAEERFSPTAMQYVVGGNFMFHGREVLFV